jgi:hypothetical protein
VYKLSPDRLYVTYFEGDPKNGLQPDLEAKQYWLDQGVPEDHVLPGNAKDNFWGQYTIASLLYVVFIFFYRNGRHWSLWTLQVSLAFASLR